MADDARWARPTPDIDDLDLTGWVVRETVLDRARFIGVVMRDAELDGLIANLVVNGVEVTAYVEAELDRRDPVRVLLRSDEPADLARGVGRAAAAVGRHRRPAAPAWVRRPRRRGVDGEWSAVQTLRHLVFVTDSWLRSAALGRTTASPARARRGLHGRPGARTRPRCPAEPGRGAGAARRAGRRRAAGARRGDSGATRGRGAGAGGGWPPPAEGRTLLDCVHVVLNEEWAHHSFCVRDLDLLERGGPRRSTSSSPATLRRPAATASRDPSRTRR